MMRLDMLAHDALQQHTNQERYHHQHILLRLKTQGSQQQPCPYVWVEHQHAYSRDHHRDRYVVEQKLHPVYIPQSSWLLPISYVFLHTPNRAGRIIHPDPSGPY